MLTIFTPIYNRCDIIDILYESLKKQTDINFEWIIIDDGSTDNFKNKAMQWILERNPFKIFYEYVQHGGKHRAINRAVHMAQGEAFFIVDSDDYLSEDAVSFISKNFSEAMKCDEIAAISGLKASFDGKIIGGDPQFTGYIDTYVFNAEQYRLGKDKAEIYKTELLKKYPFSEYEGEYFLAEGTVWERIALDGYKIRYFNKVIYYAEYRSDGLSKNMYEHHQSSPLGWAELIRIRKQTRSFETKQAMHYCYIYESLGMAYLCEVLDLNRAEYMKCKEINDTFDDNLRQLLLRENISSLAIYGCGTNAHYFINHLRRINSDIIYGIDKSVKRFEGKSVYSLNNLLPSVDGVFITVNNLSGNVKKGIINKIKEQLPMIKIWTLRELDDQLW